MSDDASTLTTLHLTDRDSLHLTARMQEALDDLLAAGFCLELAERVYPEGGRP